MLSKEMSWERMEEKVAEYHPFGVELVWVLDPQTLTIRAYPRGGTPVLARDADDVTADPQVPGLTGRVRRFFED